MKKLDVLTAVLVIIGGLNWGLIGLFDFNFVDYVFSKTWVDNLIYVIIGISAAYEFFGYKAIRKRWSKK
jgi:uncharacterized protein